jgi:hypothetical protein
MNLADLVQNVPGILLGGLITFGVSWYFFHRANAQMENMLRTFALTLEQQDAGVKVRFLRDKEGKIDLSKPGTITGKLNAALPPLRSFGEGVQGVQGAPES